MIAGVRSRTPRWPGLPDRPETTFGTVNADVPARFEPGFTRTDFVDVVEGNDGPE
jgi:hypothetical protein